MWYKEEKPELNLENNNSLGEYLEELRSVFFSKIY
jgi:hypothetical protein